MNTNKLAIRLTLTLLGTALISACTSSAQEREVKSTRAGGFKVYICGTDPENDVIAKCGSRIDPNGNGTCTVTGTKGNTTTLACEITTTPK